MSKQHKFGSHSPTISMFKLLMIITFKSNLIIFFKICFKLAFPLTFDWTVKIFFLFFYVIGVKFERKFLFLENESQ